MLPADKATVRSMGATLENLRQFRFSAPGGWREATTLGAATAAAAAGYFGAGAVNAGSSALIVSFIVTHSRSQ